MIGVVLALVSASVYGLSAVLIKRRLDASNFFSVSLVVAVTGNIILWPLALLFTNLETVSFEGVLFFAMAGIPTGIFRLFYFKGMEAVGASVNASIFATYPIYSTIFAVLLLGEAFVLEKWIGIICIVVGVACIERSLSKPRIGAKGVSRKGLIFSLLASLTVSFAYITRKHGLGIYNEPLLGAAIGYSLSFFLYVLLLIPSHTTRDSRFSSKDFELFWKAGTCLSLAMALSFYALSHERVSIVTPLLQTEPLFVLFFAHLYLKELEHMSFKLAISTFLIVIGAMLVSIH